VLVSFIIYLARHKHNLYYLHYVHIKPYLNSFSLYFLVFHSLQTPYLLEFLSYYVLNKEIFAMNDLVLNINSNLVKSLEEKVHLINLVYLHRLQMVLPVKYPIYMKIIELKEKKKSHHVNVTYIVQQ
jgi:hypothetical protein